MFSGGGANVSYMMLRLAVNALVCSGKEIVLFCFCSICVLCSVHWTVVTRLLLFSCFKGAYFVKKKIDLGH